MCCCCCCFYCCQICCPSLLLLFLLLVVAAFVFSSVVFVTIVAWQSEGWHASRRQEIEMMSSRKPVAEVINDYCSFKESHSFVLIITILHHHREQSTDVFEAQLMNEYCSLRLSSSSPYYILHHHKEQSSDIFKKSGGSSNWLLLFLFHANINITRQSKFWQFSSRLDKSM